MIKDLFSRIRLHLQNIIILNFKSVDSTFLFSIVDIESDYTRWNKLVEGMATIASVTDEYSLEELEAWKDDAQKGITFAREAHQDHMEDLHKQIYREVEAYNDEIARKQRELHFIQLAITEYKINTKPKEDKTDVQEQKNTTHTISTTTEVNNTNGTTSE